MARSFDSLFSGLPAGSPRVMGVVHLAPLPGSPGYDEKAGMTGILDRALRDAASLAGGGMAGIVVENFGDAPFWKDAVPPETVAAMARAATEIRRTVTIPVGINVLRNDALAALGIAAACQADFIRVNVLCGAMVTDQGVIEGRAAEVLRMRRALGSRALIFADVLVKHAAPLGAVDLVQAAEDTLERGGADALLLTGSGTGKPASLADAARLRKAMPDASLVVASGVTEETAGEWLRACDGAIVGTWVKKHGRLSEEVDAGRVKRLLAAAAQGLIV